MSDMLIPFDATLDTEPVLIERTGLIFECGEYPDKGFALTEAEADAAIAAFTPVPATHGHPQAAGPLDGQLGTLHTVWRDGSRLYGRATVPAWLDPMLAEAGRKISLEWDKATKRLAGWSWVTEPRVSGAALMAAYAAFAGRRHNVTDQQLLNRAHDSLVLAGADCRGAGSAIAPYAKENRMSRLDEFMAWLKGEAEQTPAPLTAPVPAPAPSVPFSAREAELATQERKLADDRAVFARQQHWAKAETDVARLIHEGRVLPAENQPTADGQPALTALFAQALADDAIGQAIFGQTGGSRYNALLACYAARAPRMVPNEEKIPAMVLPSDPGKPTKTMAPARKRKLLAFAGAPIQGETDDAD